MSFTVFYLNPRAPDDVLAMVREQMPAGWRLLSPSHPTEFARELGACDFLVVADHPVTAEHLALAPKLRMIQHQGVGYERIDLATCRARGIPLALAPQGTSVGVAEHTLLLILASFKRLVKAATGASSGRWMMWELRQGSFELAGKTLGLVGLGRIGREVAKRALAFDARVTYFDPFVPHPGDLGVRRAADLDTLLGEADIVSLHVPLTRENRHLINAATLRQMKRGALLVNTARGGLVDEAALVEALRSGRLRGAALDVLAQEPPPADNPLLHMEKVLVTPHIATGTSDAMRAKMRAVFDNLLRRTRGEPLLNVVPELADLALPARG
jgi:phosphoglycerate dehydrogenase-like enzyme